VKLYILASYFRHFDIFTNSFYTGLAIQPGLKYNPTCKISNLAFLKD